MARRGPLEEGAHGLAMLRVRDELAGVVAALRYASVAERRGTDVRATSHGATLRRRPLLLEHVELQLGVVEHLDEHVAADGLADIHALGGRPEHASCGRDPV